MLRSIFGAFVVCAALLVPAGAAADEETTATCPATATLPFAVPTASGPADATLAATLTPAGERCSGTFDVVLNGATVGNGTLSVKLEGRELRARFDGTLTTDSFSGGFRGQLELQGAGMAARGELKALFCDSGGQCQTLEASVAATDTGFVITVAGDDEEDDD